MECRVALAMEVSSFCGVQRNKRYNGQRGLQGNAQKITLSIYKIEKAAFPNMPLFQYVE